MRSVQNIVLFWLPLLQPRIRHLLFILAKLKKVEIMIINCNGDKGPSKQAAFLATLDIHKPDIVLGCESKVCNSICSYEFIPKDYAVFRKDRNVHGDGVFVATSDRIIS